MNSRAVRFYGCSYVGRMIPVPHLSAYLPRLNSPVAKIEIEDGGVAVHCKDSSDSILCDGVIVTTSLGVLPEEQ